MTVPAGPRSFRLGVAAPVLASGIVLWAGACAGPPTQPTTTEPPPPISIPDPPPAIASVAGTVIDGTTGAPVPGALVQIEGLESATADATGAFAVPTASASGVRRLTATASVAVERQTWTSVPNGALTVSLLPSSLGATAFDQMFRGNGSALTRWVAAPRLIIQRRVLRFTSATDTALPATAELLTDTEVQEIRDDLLFALPLLTGNTFPSFADITIETAAEGQTVAATQGVIVFARVEGLKGGTSFDGYTRWSWNAAGAVRSGFMMLDRGYERLATRGRRALRAHELGHALGYNHVTAAASVMQQVVDTEPSAFDQAAARLAFARPLLNRFPDSDPAPGVSGFAERPDVAAPALYWKAAP